MPKFTTYHPQFFTATILEWKHLLVNEKYIQIIVDTLAFLVAANRVKIFGFVIMHNHVHIIWQIIDGNTREQVQNSLLRHTAQKILADLRISNPKLMEQFRVDAKDRTYQIWERNALSIDLYSRPVFLQKMEYLHNNPCRKDYCKFPEEYKYSSASLYYLQKTEFDFITHYDE